MCSHGPAGILAAFTVVVFVAAFPVVALHWLWHDTFLNHQLREHTASRPGSHLLAHNAETCSACTKTLYCKRQRRVLATSSVSDPTVCEAAADFKIERERIPAHTGATLETLFPDAMLEPFLGEYVPTLWYTKHVDLYSVLTLSLLQVRTRLVRSVVLFHPTFSQIICC
jgi:hypothetical protein